MDLPGISLLRAGKLLWPAAFVAAMALIAATLLWKGGTRPAVVTLAPKQIAVVAPRLLGLPLTNATLKALTPRQISAVAPTILGVPVANAGLVVPTPRHLPAEAPAIPRRPVASANPLVLTSREIAAAAPNTLGFPRSSAILAAVSVREIAGTAPNILGFPSASASLSPVPLDSSLELKEPWDVLPPDKGALFLFVPSVAADRVVVVRDEIGRVLDSIDAKSGSPLLRQYRLDPGTYELNLKGFAAVVVTIKSGKRATIQLSQSGVNVSYKRSQTWDPLVGPLRDSGSDIGPRNISPAENVLNFTAELPGRHQPDLHLSDSLDLR
jgi:hypothetical protein